MRLVLTRHTPEVESVSYIDADVVVRTRWSDIVSPAPSRIMVVADIQTRSPYHPHREAAAQVASDHGWPVQHALDYVNAGFVRVPRAQEGFLERWETANTAIRRITGAHQELLIEDANHPFRYLDQDALNLALASWDTPPAIWPCEAMDFRPGGQLLSHAAGSPKPWQGSMLARSLRRKPPGLPDKFYWMFAEGCVRAHPTAWIRWKRWEWQMAFLIGQPWKDLLGSR
jgi:hypothetical protein